MKRGKAREEENCKNHANDVIILQWSNTALGNRLDHFKRTLEQMKSSDQNLQNLCGCYEFFFSAFFSGWKNFLAKLERLNQLVKKQEGADRHIQKFKQVFEGIDELALIMNKFKENACGENDLGNDKTKNNNQSIQGRQQQLIDMQKLTKTRVEGFLKVFEGIYTETVIEMSAQEERMAEAIKNLVSSNDQNETSRKLYKENTQLQARLKELEQLLTKDVSLIDTEKDFLMNNFAAQSKIIKDLQMKLAEEKELSERLSLRLRQKMDYSFMSISHKTGQQQPDAATVLTQIQEGASAILEDKKMEIEDQNGNVSPTQFFTVNKKGYECVCGGVQVEYTRQKFEDALKKITDLKPQLISVCASTLTQQDSVGGLAAVGSSLAILAPQNSIACNIEGENQTLGTAGEIREGKVLSIEKQGIKNDEKLPSGTLIESEKRVTFEEMIALLSKQKDQLIEESVQQEKVIREMELEMKNIEEKFFHSGVYQSLVSQVEDLARIVTVQRNQLREAKFMLEGIEKLRQREVQELLTRYNDEKTQLMKEAQDAKEGVLQENLGEIIRNNLDQHFNFKKYTAPLEDQIAKLSESLEIQRQHCQNLEEQKQESQKAALDQEKNISDLASKLHEREQTILVLESQIQNEKCLENKTFKYAKHKEIIVSVEKILSNLTGQNQQEDVLKNFRELILYLKAREEKVNLLETKLKQSETERKKMQISIDQIWKDYESLDEGFTKLKKANDAQIAELKTHAEKEQDLETKNLEIMMKFEKEQHAQKILLQSEQSKREATKQLIDAMTEQNKVLSQQNQESVQLIEDIKNMNANLKLELEQSNADFVESQQRQKLMSRKQLELNTAYQELILDHERTKAKLQNAYDVLENIDNKEINNSNKNSRKAHGNDTILSAEQEQIRNLTSLLQCQCGERIKDTILYKCLHPFCRQCIDKQLKTRQRTCPKCRTPFGNSDIKTLYLSN